MGLLKSKFIISAILVIFVLASGVKCQSEDDDQTTLAPDEDSSTEELTTVEPSLSTTTLAPLRELDFRMVNIVGNFFVDVNFTEIREDPNSVEMVVKIDALPDTEPSRFLCEGLLGIYLLDLPTCEGLDISLEHQARRLATLNKRSGFETAILPDLSIPFLLSHNCLVVAADNKTYGEIFTSTSTSTSTVAPSTTESSEDTTLAIEANPDEAADARFMAFAKKFRQLNNNIETPRGSRGDYEKHQYDVKKVANQDQNAVDEEDEPLSVTERESGDSGIDPDFYDPEDFRDDENLKGEELERDPNIEESLGAGNPGIEDDSELDEKFGLDKRTLAIFRKEGCQANATLQRIPLLGGLQRAQTRTFFFLPTRFAIVLSSGSVSSGSSSATLASSPGVIYFGDTGGSFTFNPLANWPVVVLQGYYVLATYGVIIIWALILGAIIWGISISQFSGLFSAKRVGYVASELIYRPLERMTSSVYSGIEKFSALNRRNQQRKSFRRPSASAYRHRSNKDYEYEEIHFENESNEDQWFKY